MDLDKVWPIIQAGANAVSVLSIIVIKVLWSKLTKKEDTIDAIRVQQFVDAKEEAKKGSEFALFVTKITEQAAENLNLALTKRNDERATEKGEKVQKKRRRSTRP